MKGTLIMKICIDIQTALNQPTGVGHYTMELAKHIAAILETDELILFYFDFIKKKPIINNNNVTLKTIRCFPERVIRRFWRYLKWPPFNLLAGPANIYHFPNFILPPLKHGKSVVTIHDLSFLRFPEFAPTRYARYLSSIVKETVTRADAIITDSMFSKDEIEQLLHVDADRLYPIYPGISSRFQALDKETIKPILSKLNLDRPYILTISTIEPRKNIPFLISIFERLLGFDGNLVIAGKLGWKYEPILERIHTSSRTDDILYLNYVEDKDLPALYSGAELFVFTSHYEGFGLPPLEAMACGVPVVASSGGSLGEVLGEGAYVIQNFDLNTWTEAIQNILFSSDLRNKQITKGYNRAGNYTWYNSASQVLQLYKMLV